MKKILIIVCTLFIVITIGTYSFNFIKYKTEKSAVTSPPPASGVTEIDDGIIRISISAAGDCTFGTDINSVGYNSFDSEVVTQKNDYTYFLRLVKPYFEKDDLTIVNFEGTLSESGERADKQYAFRGNPEYVKILTFSSVEAVNLANNHTLDYGTVAFSDTKKIMDENGIANFRGSDVTVREIKGVKVGMIGSNLLRYEDKKNFLKNLEALKELEPDLIIASFHWGIERAYTPASEQMEYAHLAIDNGADLVIGHHPHVLQGIEKYNGKYIVYSLGNFCFGGNRNPDDKDTMIFNQVFSFKDGKFLDEENVSVIPCSISSVSTRNNYQPMPLKGDEFKRVKEKIIELSADYEGIANVEFVENLTD